VLFFGLSTWVVAGVVAVVLFGATLAGLAVGRVMAARSDGLSEPFGVLQGALIGFMGLVLAFGLSLAVGRYEARRANVVDEANAIGTTYLRAQTLAEPERTASLALLRDYADTSIDIAETVPGSDEQDLAISASGREERRLWTLAGQALDGAPVASAPRLYVEALNDMFDAQSTRVYGLLNRVPSAVVLVMIVGAALALGVLALHLATFGRGVLIVLIAASLVGLLLVVTFDLDRPTRGLITVPAGPLQDVAATMTEAPAAQAPTNP